MSLKYLLFVTFFIFFSLQVSAQNRRADYNRIGLTGGITFFDIATDDFVTQQTSGFLGGFTTRGAYRNNFDIIYGINFSSQKVAIQANPGTNTQFVNYTIQGAQLKLLASYHIIKYHLTLEFGPLLQVNGKMKLDSEREKDYLIEGFNNLRAEQIQNISPINGHLLGGLMAGFKSFKLSAHYQYGFTNTFNKLNSEGLERQDFKGNTSLIFVGAVVYI